MADSDDEYDRRRARDKFRRERSDYQERREERSRRDDWNERDSWGSRDRPSGRRDYREYDPRSRRDRYSPPPRHEISPPMKRIRRDWDDRGGYGGYEMGYPAGGGNMMAAHHGGGWGGGVPQDINMMHGQHGYGGHPGPQRDLDPGLTQPPMMTFKQFLASQDDHIDDQEAVKRYNEYKLEFRRQQINEFFLNHKEEEWFKSRYHPEESARRKAEQLAALKRRLEVFLEMTDKDWVQAITVDVEKSEQILKLFDAVVIRLEGGTDLDLKILDEPYEEDKPKEAELFLLGGKEDAKKDDDDKDSSKPLQEPPSSEQESHVKDKEYDENKKQMDDEEESSNNNRRKRSRDYSYDEDESSVESESDAEPLPPGLDEEADSVTQGDEVVNGEKKKKRKKKKVPDTSDVEDNASKEAEEPPAKTNEEKEEDAEAEERSLDDTDGVSEKTEDNKDDSKEEEVQEKEESVKGADGEEARPVSPKPRPLHRTCSIFLRNLAPTITKQEVEAMCKRYPGFLRVAIQDPQPERRFFRRGWVTFERTVNIKEICWDLNNIRLRDCELGAIVNRDLSRRIRSVNGITSHKQVVRSDIKMITRIVQNLDAQRGLWTDDNQKIEIGECGFGLVSNNPLLKNITDYLIEEASAEEEELLGVAEQEDNKEGEEGSCTLEKDETLIKVLDKLVLYLRIVHSVDYYNHIEYPNEDEMPNRCGILHARGSPPSSKVTQQEINDYISHFAQKVIPFLEAQMKLSDEEAVKLGKKNCEVEVEKFIQANTQELAKDKWLCPLSGKKFKGPEFVRKHIFNKHNEKIDEVKKEVEYFNNYLLDAKRPQLQEHPSSRANVGMPGSGPGREGHIGMGPFQGGPAGYGPPPPFGGFGVRGPGGPGYQGFGGRSAYPEFFGRPGFGKRNNFGRNLRSEPRKITTYRDLDAPNDIDLF